MKYIIRFNELSEHEDIEDSMEACKDIIETFDEYYPNIVVVGYGRNAEKLTVGFCESNDDEKDYFGSFRDYMSNPNDKKAIYFSMSSKSDSEDENKNWHRSIDTVDDINRNIELMEKSRTIFLRLKSYTNLIRYRVSNLRIEFEIAFDNEDKKLKTDFTLNKLYKNIIEYFNTRENKVLGFRDGEIVDSTGFKSREYGGPEKDISIKIKFSTTITTTKDDMISISISKILINRNDQRLYDVKEFKSFKNITDKQESIIIDKLIEEIVENLYWWGKLPKYKNYHTRPKIGNKESNAKIYKADNNTILIGILHHGI